MANHGVAPEIAVHKEWLGQIQQVGLVVSPAVLARRGVGINKQDATEIQRRLEGLVTGDEDDPQIPRFVDFAGSVLEWPEDILAGGPGGPDLPPTLNASLPEHEDVLSPTFAVTSGGTFVALVMAIEGDFDTLPDHHHHGWRATPHARLERLLRETEIPIGLLYSGRGLRLLYAPRGETSGYLTFRFKDLLHTQGRPMAGALDALLKGHHFTGVYAGDRRLPALLKESRKFQNEVSTKLAGQVLEALWELVRGFQRANEESGGRLLGDILREDSNEVYGGLLSTLMRLVFILYAEDRGLMPASDVYQSHYSLLGLFTRLQDDEANHPDTMDARYGSWGQLLALFRLVHDGGSHGDLKFPPRHGRLFDPDAYPFLEGRPAGSHRSTGELIAPPKISDGVIFRVLRNLLILEGERLSYRALDVEQIGSVYEAMMGFALRQAAGPSIAVSPKHIVFDIRELLEQVPSKRVGWLQEHAEAKVIGDALGKAKAPEDVVAALGKKVSLHTPHILKAGDIYLQPTEERRRSGSHYTPRSLTEPIVRTTFRPIFERLGEHATPEQILDLKVCDPAMGSGAFLVEACRLLADRLVKAWETHRSTPKNIPPDEDIVTFARRLVAERCLYGVDKNVFAVDLAKLSLWLATLAREHPFTFLDHSLRHGDSLVGLSREQIACVNWDEKGQLPLLRGEIDARVARAQELRERIQLLATSDDIPEKARLLREANDEISDVRRLGDAVIGAFFGGEKSKQREQLRVLCWAAADQWVKNSSAGFSLRSDMERTTFHWQIEFPEVFMRPHPGFDAFVGNPPFAGKNTITASNGSNYLQWLLDLHAESHGNADLVAHFYRRSYNLLRSGGTFGLIATNTIAQGDTRVTGLQWIRSHNGKIFAARKRIKWPGSAAVIVSVVHVVKDGIAGGPFLLDDRFVDQITAFLFHTGTDLDPLPLSENENICFIGSYVLGMGFTFDDTDKAGVASSLSVMRALVDKDPKNQEHIFPFVGGEEVNDSPSVEARRYIINFGLLSESEARKWPDLIDLLEARVKGKRASHSTGEWWQFERPRAELYESIRGLKRVLVNCQVGPHLSFAFLPATWVYAHTLAVFADERFAFFATLQSRIHEVWTRLLASSMKDDLRYTPSNCFETFPFPEDWVQNELLERIGLSYYEFRSARMLDSREGLTKTYNRFHDPNEQGVDILRLRELHAEMDGVVLDAYGWTDLRPTCEFLLDYDEDQEGDAVSNRRKKPWRYRWPDDVRDEVLGRLLELNAARVSAQRSSRNSRALAPGADSGLPLLS